MEKLKTQRYRDSTRQTYYRIWKLFAQFYLRLDHKPKYWEDRLTLFTAFLIEKKLKSSTVKSYLSAIKAVLTEDEIEFSENTFLLNSLTRACRIRNDQYIPKLPIHKSLLKLLIDQITKWFAGRNQHYLEILFKAMFLSCYYGLLRSGEVAKSEYVILARNINIGVNKDKILFKLLSSKTHGLGDKPQRIKITRTTTNDQQDQRYCPFNILQQYIQLRPDMTSSDEQFFVFSDGSAVKPQHI